jgi:hypothetical protein
LLTVILDDCALVIILSALYVPAAFMASIYLANKV